MDRYELIERLRSWRSELAGLGVRRLVMFGPVARNEGGPASEVDFLVELDPPLTFAHYLAVRDYLARLLGRSLENIW